MVIIKPRLSQKTFSLVNRNLKAFLALISPVLSTEDLKIVLILAWNFHVFIKFAQVRNNAKISRYITKRKSQFSAFDASFSVRASGS
jgi:hypothetical protein